MNSYLRHLVNFAHVVNAGSITSAANRERTSPSTMSESVKIIENFAGQPLLERTRSGVVLLGEGRAIYTEAMAILEALNRVGQTRNSSELVGEVRISLPVELATGWFTAAVAQVRATLPDINLVLMAEDAMLDHQKHTRDLYIRVSQSETSKGMHVLHHMPTKAVMIASGAYARTFDINDIQAVSEQTFICAPNTDAKTTLSLTRKNRRERASISFRNRLQINDIVTRIQFARASMGLTCCIASTVDAELRTEHLVRVLPDAFGPRLHLLMGSPRRSPPSRVRAVSEVVSKCFPAR